jgi:hypothetical protein
MAAKTALDPVMLKVKMAEEPTAMPPLGDPPPIQFAPSAPPAVNDPNGGAVNADTARKFALVHDTKDIPVTPDCMFTASPVMYPPFAGSVVLLRSTETVAVDPLT